MGLAGEINSPPTGGVNLIFSIFFPANYFVLKIYLNLPKTLTKLNFKFEFDSSPDGEEKKNSLISGLDLLTLLL